MSRPLTRCPSPCCRTGAVPDDARAEAMAVYVPLARREDRSEILLMYPVTLLRWVIGPFSERWRREVGLSCPFADRHLQQAVLWLVVCVVAATGAAVVAAIGTWLAWTRAPEVAPRLAVGGFGLVCASTVVWVAGQVLGAYRASEGQPSGPPFVGRLVRKAE